MRRLTLAQALPLDVLDPVELRRGAQPTIYLAASQNFEIDGPTPGHSDRLGT